MGAMAKAAAGVWVEPSTFDEDLFPGVARVVWVELSAEAVAKLEARGGVEAGVLEAVRGVLGE